MSEMKDSDIQEAIDGASGISNPQVASDSSESRCACVFEARDWHKSLESTNQKQAEEIQWLTGCLKQANAANDEKDAEIARYRDIAEWVRCHPGSLIGELQQQLGEIQCLDSEIEELKEYLAVYAKDKTERDAEIARLTEELETKKVQVCAPGGGDDAPTVDPLRLAVRLMDVLHFNGDRVESWWGFAIYHAQRSQIGCAIYRCQPGQGIFDTSQVFGMDICDTIPDAIFGAIADAMKDGERSKEWRKYDFTAQKEPRHPARGAETASCSNCTSLSNVLKLAEELIAQIEHYDRTWIVLRARQVLSAIQNMKDSK